MYLFRREGATILSSGPLTCFLFFFFKRATKIHEGKNEKERLVLAVNPSELFSGNKIALTGLLNRVSLSIM